MFNLAEILAYQNQIILKFFYLFVTDIPGDNINECLI